MASLASGPLSSLGEVRKGEGTWRKEGTRGLPLGGLMLPTDEPGLCVFSAQGSDGVYTPNQEAATAKRWLATCLCLLDLLVFLGLAMLELTTLLM